jgi:competence CoiA-like predicted nuclease
MFIAIDEIDQIIEIENALKGNKYFCPECGSKLIVKDGQINVKHFAHEKSTECGSWGDMSQWHLDWQSKFDKSVREVVLEKDGIKHRADIFISVKDINLTIEFQKSPISKIEIIKRNEFYSQFGNVLWVFDLKDKEIHIDYNRNYKNLHKYKWNHFSKSIPTPKEFAEMNINFCFQLSNNEIVFPCGVEKENWKYSYSLKTDLIDPVNFIQRIKDDFFLKPNNINRFIEKFITPDEYKKQKVQNTNKIKHKVNSKIIIPNYDELTWSQKEAIEFGYNTIEDFVIHIN